MEMIKFNRQKLNYEYCKTPEDFKAWSQNLGHNSPLTTFMSYGGHIEEYNQGAIIKRLGKNDDGRPVSRKEINELLSQKYQA